MRAPSVDGIPGHHLHLYLKEGEWRFIYGSAGQLLKSLEHWLPQEQWLAAFSMPAPCVTAS